MSGGKVLQSVANPGFDFDIDILNRPIHKIIIIIAISLMSDQRLITSIKLNDLGESIVSAPACYYSAL